MSWLSANDIRTDWSEINPRDRRMRPDPEATIPCGLLDGRRQPCKERFFNAEGRALHRQRDHDKHSRGPACECKLCRKYGPVWPPMAERDPRDVKAPKA